MRRHPSIPACWQASRQSFSLGIARFSITYSSHTTVPRHQVYELPGCEVAPLPKQGCSMPRRVLPVTQVVGSIDLSTSTPYYSHDASYHCSFHCMWTKPLGPLRRV